MNQTAFGPGRGPQMMKELMIVFSVWVVAKLWIPGNRPPPPNTKNRFKYDVPRELYKYEKPRLIGH